MLDLILKGGIINVILLFAYFYVMVICLERSIYFFILRGNYQKFKNKLLSLLSKNSKSVLSENHIQRFKKTPYFKITKSYIDSLNKTQQTQREIIKKDGNQITRKMETLVWTLNLIGHVAPLMGLLGTMTGLIKSFKAIEALGGHVDLSVLAGGIWEAMMTTVVGLVVAIIAFSIHKMFDQHIETKTNNMTDLILELDIFFNRNIENANSYKHKQDETYCEEV